MLLVRAFYKFVALQNLETLQAELSCQARVQDLRGSIILAAEGINGTVAGESSNLESFWPDLLSRLNLDSIDHKDSHSSAEPFRRLKVTIKPEIVTLRNSEANPSETVGEYVEPEDWNDLISRNDVFVLDTRNDYEVAEGTFRGAVDPKTTSFPEFPAWVEQNLDPDVHKRVAMFCTGGIRCEKASSLLLARGFEQVYHLRGGILSYLEKVPEDQSLFEGSCFVFDDRGAVRTGLEPESRKFEQETR